MGDMSQVIVAKSDQLNADDLISGPRTICITGVSINAGTEQPVAISFDGDNGKPWKPCKTMCRILVGAWKDDAKKYIGRSLTLYRDPNVTWGGMKVGGIRISHMSDIEHELVMALMASNKKKGIVTVKPLVASDDDGITAARAAIAGAASLDALKAVWTSKGMAPYRTQLQPDLDTRKAELAFEPETGKPDADLGEIVTLAEAIDQVSRQTSVPEVNRIVNALTDSFDEAEADQLRTVAAEKCEQILREQG